MQKLLRGQFAQGRYEEKHTKADIKANAQRQFKELQKRKGILNN